MTSERLLYWGALAVAVIANVSANTALKITMASISTDSAKGTVLQVLTKGSFWSRVPRPIAYVILDGASERSG
jgi:hypothetical protein